MAPKSAIVGWNSHAMSCPVSLPPSPSGMNAPSG